MGEIITRRSRSVQACPSQLQVLVRAHQGDERTDSATAELAASAGTETKRFHSSANLGFKHWILHTIYGKPRIDHDFDQNVKLADGAAIHRFVTDLTPALSQPTSSFSGQISPMPQVVENAAREQLLDDFSSELAPESETRLAVEPRLSRDGSLVAQALERLRTDPSVSRGELAEGLGVSPSKLGKAFRAQMGIAFVDYRNQLRLERFLKLVFPGGGNVSQAAKSAGFGSYAQFHRVFRALVGKSPKEYLKQQTAAS